MTEYEEAAYADTGAADTGQADTDDADTGDEDYAYEEPVGAGPLAAGPLAAGPLAAGPVGAEPEQPAAPGLTGHPAVDAALHAVAATEHAAPADQIAAYQAAHRTLRETLASIDEQ